MLDRLVVAVTSLLSAGVPVWLLDAGQAAGAVLAIFGVMFAGWRAIRWLDQRMEEKLGPLRADIDQCKTELCSIRQALESG